MGILKSLWTRKVVVLSSFAILILASGQLVAEDLGDFPVAAKWTGQQDKEKSEKDCTLSRLLPRQINTYSGTGEATAKSGVEYYHLD